MISTHFSEHEMTFSQTAARRQIDNKPGPVALANLRRVALEILEPVRAHFGKPVHIHSGYRSLALNRLIPGSAPTSEHQYGMAADFEVAGHSNYEVAKWIAAGNLRAGFGQLILEHYDRDVPGSGWVHCSVQSANHKNEVLTIIRSGRRYVRRYGLVLVP